MLSVEFDKVVRNVDNTDTHMLRDHIIHKHGVLSLHLAKILGPQESSKNPPSTFFELSLARLFRQHSLSLAEALALCISVVFCTQIHSIVWYTPILLQVCKSLHRACGTLLHPPSLPRRRPRRRPARFRRRVRALRRAHVLEPAPGGRRPRRRLPRRQRRLPVRRVPGARGQPARLGRALQLLLRLGLRVPC